MTITAPLNFEISSDVKTWTSSIKLSPTLGKLAQTTISIRPLASLKAGTYSGDIVHTTQGATTLNVTVKSVITLPLGNEKEGDFATIVLSPNPVQDILKVNHPQSFVHDSLVIYALGGNKMGTFMVQTGTESTTINVSALPNGTYLLHYLSEKGNSVIKFIKQ